MPKPLGKYHFEFIPKRKKGHQWRVGDEDDDPVTDFDTECEASAYVRDHNHMVEQYYSNRVAT